MATTTNFGWETPDDTDLVKDGAAAIRTALGGVDTSFVDLKGGTTGQVLAKASNTDLDYTWTTPSTPAGFADNAILNSGFNVWQRGTSISLSASSGVVYTADRWAISTNASQACTVSRQATGDTTNLPFIQYAMRVQRNSGQTGTGLLLTTQSLETINSIGFAGKTVTVSFYARAGANYSSASSALTAYFMTGTGTDQNRQSGGYTGEVTGSNTATLTTTWQRFTHTYSVASTATEVAVGFAYTPVGTASTNDYFEVTGVQLEIGSSATAYHANQPTYQAELAACQRYYYASNAGIVTAGIAPSTAYIYGRLVHPVPMRTTPSGSISASGTTFTVTDDYSAAFSSTAVTGFTNDSWITSTSARVSLSGFTGLTGGRYYSVDGRSAGQIMFSAEL